MQTRKRNTPPSSTAPGKTFDQLKLEQARSLWDGKAHGIPYPLDDLLASTEDEWFSGLSKEAPNLLQELNATLLNLHDMKLTRLPQELMTGKNLEALRLAIFRKKFPLADESLTPAKVSRIVRTFVARQHVAEIDEIEASIRREVLIELSKVLSDDQMRRVEVSNTDLTSAIDILVVATEKTLEELRSEAAVLVWQATHVSAWGANTRKARNACKKGVPYPLQIVRDAVAAIKIPSDEEVRSFYADLNSILGAQFGITLTNFDDQLIDAEDHKTAQLHKALPLVKKTYSQLAGDLREFEESVVPPIYLSIQDAVRDGTLRAKNNKRIKA